MANDISQPWEQLQLSLEQFGEDVIASIDNVFDWTDQFLGTELEDSQDTVFPLVSTLISQQLVLESEVETVLSDLQGDLRTLRTDALSGIRTSFIGKRMENAYNNARCQSGRGSDACRKAIINSAVNQNGLFADLLRKFRKDFNEHVKNAQDRIHEAVESNLGAIQDTLDIIRSDNIALESEKDPEFRERVTAALETTKQEMERLRSVLAA
ncbi:putative nuclear GTPase SLIP-GC [Rosellinia necatrix]|uniref:Putative nuclear GTPase SLIP-GC n=1 Tax=Rosellinia necatrix TaxID=77044 RepID=A0A1S8A8W1_ROSNE|nr:putative nuclear GTPase SLIP-GC [Rosellinia necatrix]